ncbi:tRNA synthetases class II core domain family protein [Acinetobacter baumannii 959073]|nr:aminoacyl tRNA ligase class II, N-terminal domain protein [Acinetobacter baumannii UH0207]EXD96127.1 tRNA synthetases class II core domain family protein [Acinetobacter baumannii 959073]
MSLEALTTEALAAIAAAQDLVALDQVRVQFTGKKSQLAEQSKALGKMDPEERKVQGAAIHAVRETINNALTERQTALQQAALAQKLASETIDITLPGRGQRVGTVHPVTQVQERICQFFTKAGFTVATGPEVEDDYHNFEALNIPGTILHVLCMILSISMQTICCVRILLVCKFVPWKQASRQFVLSVQAVYTAATQTKRIRQCSIKLKVCTLLRTPALLN